MYPKYLSLTFSESAGNEDPVKKPKRSTPSGNEARMKAVAGK
jgi:hypothetical protein